ncbi:MAG: TadE/TadG family type IV pilus assembly protein [Alphaproteobacteria bacterium]
MCGWFDKLARDRRGTTAVEFAFLLPLLLMVLLTLTELGRGFLQANAVEKGLRAGGLYAARAEYPLPAAASQTVENLVKTGTLDGAGSYLAPGWADAAAAFSFPPPTTFAVDDQDVPVYSLSASVPFEPLFPGVMSMLGLGGTFVIELTHEQAYVGT